MTEKINWRILFDRREVLAWTCDKLQMKVEVAKLCPEIKIPAVLWTGDDLNELADLQLPERWVLKPNHRSGYVHLREGRPDVDALKAESVGWLDELNYARFGEWAYGQAKRTFFIEEALGDNGQPPPDYKFYVFDGVVRLIQVDHDRYGNHSRNHYTADWEPVDLKVGNSTAEVEPPPEALPRLLDFASRIGKPFDFMRVDLYLWNDDIYFGEVTPYPASGRSLYEPASLDALMGSYWTLPKL